MKAAAIPCLLLMIAGVASAGDKRPVVVVELFTSEGCSSCPPADKLLRTLSQQPVSGAQIIALSEHVDYWDHLGWRDPFSSPLFTSRQQAYGELFQIESVYTPQMVVDGMAQFNGADGDQVRKMIRQAAYMPKATVEVTRKDGEGRLAILVSQLSAAKTEQADVFLAVTENGLESSVAAGENAGEHLFHAAVVRSLMRVAQIDAKRGTYAADVKVKIQPNWQVIFTHAVVFVQDRKTRRIIGAATCSL